MSNFDQCIEITLKNEGGFVNDPLDHGGATNRGITQGTLARWRKHPVTPEDVKSLSLVETKQIYKAWYWDTLRLDLIKSPISALCIFDTGVLCGPVTSMRIAQVVSSVTVPTGSMSPETVDHINQMDQVEFAKAFVSKLKLHYDSIVARRPSQIRFLKGWKARANRLIPPYGKLS